MTNTRFGMLAAMSALAMASTGRIYGDVNIKRHIQSVGRAKTRSEFNPKINRHTGKPHEHKRAIARNLRQAAARGEA